MITGLNTILTKSQGEVKVVHQEVDWAKACSECYFADGCRRRSAQQWQSHRRLPFSGNNFSLIFSLH